MLELGPAGLIEEKDDLIILILIYWFWYDIDCVFIKTNQDGKSALFQSIPEII